MNYFVVDDEVAICQGTCRRLQHFINAEDSIRYAYSAEQALEILDSYHPDILITDIRMGAITGLQLIERCKDRYGDVACIIITAFDTFSYAQQAIKLEVKDFLVKPYGESDLRRSIEHILREKQERSKQEQAYLEKQVYRCMQEGGGLSDIRFSAVPPSAVYAVRWKEGMGNPSEWHTGWSFKDQQHCYMLVGSANQSMAEWASENPDFCFGISEPGTDLRMLWQQANEALDLCSMDSALQYVFYQSDFDTRPSLRRNQMVLCAINYVNSHIGSSVTMEDICGAQHWNYSYFSKQFKQQTGMPFSEYVLRRQMEWSLQQLLNGRRVNEIAYALGYSSPESYGKAFTRIYGAAPRAYISRYHDKQKTNEAIPE